MQQRKNIVHEKQIFNPDQTENTALITDLEKWFCIFNTEFFNSEFDCPLITVEPARVTNLGSVDKDIRLGTIININSIHIANREYWDVLATLLHESIHLYLEPNCEKATWYHGKPFQAKAEECGLHVGAKGDHQFVTDPFIALLRQHGIEFGFFKQTEQGIIAPQPTIEKPKGRSKLIHWSCGCTNVRVAIRYFKAKCLKCNNDFKKID